MIFNTKMRGLKVKHGKLHIKDQQLTAHYTNICGQDREKKAV